jgi:hypothetical protein
VNRPDLRWDTESRAGEKLAVAEEVRGLEGRVDSRVMDCGHPRTGRASLIYTSPMGLFCTETSILVYTFFVCNYYVCVSANIGSQINGPIQAEILEEPEPASSLTHSAYYLD